MERFLEALLYLHGPLPYAAAFGILLLCGLGLPIPEDITLFTMGLLSYYGLVDLKISIVVCLAGVLIGDCIIYWFGRHYGVRLLKRKFFARVLHEDRMDKVKALFHRWGNRVIIVVRFMPGLRAPAYFSAGSLHLPFKVFLFYDGLAAVLSVPLLTGLTFYFGDHVDRAIQIARKVQHGVVLVILALILILIAKHFLLKRHR